MASGLVPGQPPCPLILGRGDSRPEEDKDSLPGTLVCGGIGPEMEGRGRSTQAFPGQHVHRELGGTAQSGQIVPVGDQQATGLARSLSSGVTGSEQCLRKIYLAAHGG